MTVNLKKTSFPFAGTNFPVSNSYFSESSEVLHSCVSVQSIVQVQTAAQLQQLQAAGATAGLSRLGLTQWLQAQVDTITVSVEFICFWQLSVRRFIQRKEKSHQVGPVGRDRRGESDLRLQSYMINQGHETEIKYCMHIKMTKHEISAVSQLQLLLLED